MILGLRTWRNGEEGDVVQKIIEHNFKVTGKYLSYQMMCMPTQTRKLLTSDYLSEGLIVFDTDLNQWYQFKNRDWEPYEILARAFTVEFSANEWSNNIIEIPFSMHKKEDPVAHLFMKTNSGYTSVISETTVDSNFNIVLSSDLAFEGKVIIK